MVSNVLGDSRLELSCEALRLAVGHKSEVLMKSALPGNETNSLTDRSLIDQLRKREPEALVAVYDRYATRVYSLVIAITRDQRTSEDLVLELFFRLWHRSSRIDPIRGSLRIWLLCAARTMAIDHVKLGSAQSANLSWPAEHVERLSCGLGLPEHESMMDGSAKIKAAMRTLDSPQRQVLELAYLSGSSLTEIAALLGQPLNTVKSWMRSALLHVRQTCGSRRSPTRPPG